MHARHPATRPTRTPCRHEDFSTAGMKQEEIVNLGLKELVLKAFVKPAGGAVEATPPAQPPVAGKRARGGLRRSK